MLEETIDVPFPAGKHLRILNHRIGKNRLPPDQFEREYLEALADVLRPGMIVYDVGAEEGEFSAFAAQLVGGASMHLFEPAPWCWPNIWSVWLANRLAPPAGCWPGFVGAEIRGSWPLFRTDGWPREVEGPLCLDGAFANLAEHPHLPCITLDAYGWSAWTAPDVLMIDVEGSEWPVLLGAADVLRKARPHVFLSLHPDEWQAPYGGSTETILAYLRGFGYEARHLHTDHEAHWQFTPRAR